MQLFFVYKHLFISNAVAQYFGTKITQLTLAHKSRLFDPLPYSFWLSLLRQCATQPLFTIETTWKQTAYTPIVIYINPPKTCFRNNYR